MYLLKNIQYYYNKNRKLAIKKCPNFDFELNPKSMFQKHVSIEVFQKLQWSIIHVPIGTQKLRLLLFCICLTETYKCL